MNKILTLPHSEQVASFRRLLATHVMHDMKQPDAHENALIADRTMTFFPKVLCGWELNGNHSTTHVSSVYAKTNIADMLCYTMPPGSNDAVKKMIADEQQQENEITENETDANKTKKQVSLKRVAHVRTVADVTANLANGLIVPLAAVDMTMGRPIKYQLKMKLRQIIKDPAFVMWYSTRLADIPHLPYVLLQQVENVDVLCTKAAANFLNEEYIETGLLARVDLREYEDAVLLVTEFEKLIRHKVANQSKWLDVPGITPADMDPTKKRKADVPQDQKTEGAATTPEDGAPTSDKKKKAKKGGAFDSAREARKKYGCFFCTPDATLKDAFPAEGLTEKICFGHTCVDKLCAKPHNGCKFAHPNQVKDIKAVDRPIVFAHMIKNGSKVWINEARLGCEIPEEFKKLVGNAEGPRG